MRVYVKNGESDETQFRYPEDMKKIMDYLQAHGTVQVQEKSIELFYEIFSDSQYDAGWLHVNDQILEEFADWLSKKDY